MGDDYDQYREALVLEQATIWADEFDEFDLAERTRIEKALHENPEEAAELEYVRTHTGFCRQISVTQADLDRLGQAAS